MSITTENTFETALVQSLVEQGGYTTGTATDYDPESGMFKYEVIRFLQESQPKRWEKITAIHGSDAYSRVVQRLCKELDLRGSLDVLRNGFVDYGVRFQMAYFQPASSLTQVPQKVSLSLHRSIVVATFELCISNVALSSGKVRTVVTVNW